MLKYLDLLNLKVDSVSTDEQIITKGVNVNIPQNCSIKEMNDIVDEHIKSLVKNLEEDKIYNFAIDVLDTENNELSEEEFESVVKVSLAALFRNIKLEKGRNRERRLDVPEDMKKSINCNMSIIKSAINAKTSIDKFQLTISSRSLQFILVGGYDE